MNCSVQVGILFLRQHKSKGYISFGFENSEIGKLSFLFKCEVTSVFVTTNTWVDCSPTKISAGIWILVFWFGRSSFYSSGLSASVPRGWQPRKQNGIRRKGTRTSFANLASYSSHQVKTIRLSRAGPLGLVGWIKVEEGGVSKEHMEKMRRFYR